MRRCTAKERGDFVGLLYEHVPRNEPRPMTVGMLALKLLQYGATLGRLAEEQCNGYQDYRGNWDEKATERSEKKEARIQAKVTELCKGFGCEPIFQGDPRGNVLKIKVPDGYTNDWGREGICVPTS